MRELYLNFIFISLLFTFYFLLFLYPSTCCPGHPFILLKVTCWMINVKGHWIWYRLAIVAAGRHTYPKCFLKFYGWVCQIYMFFSLSTLTPLLWFLFLVRKILFLIPLLLIRTPNGHLRVPWEGLLILRPLGMIAAAIMDCNKIFSSSNFSVASVTNLLFILFCFILLNKF